MISYSDMITPDKIYNAEDRVISEMGRRKLKICKKMQAYYTSSKYESAGKK